MSKPERVTDEEGQLDELGHRHPWEEAVFLDHEVPDEAREKFKYRGLFQSGSSATPLLLFSVKGVDHKGHHFHWLARRHRKRVRQHHEARREDGKPPPVSWLGCLNVAAQAGKLGWWVAVFYTLGSVLFIVSGAGGEARWIVENSEGLQSPYARFIAWPNLVAAWLCFFPGGILQTIESQNMDYEGRVRAWSKQGRRGRKPRLRLWPRKEDTLHVGWLGAIVQLSGMLGFNLATLSSLMNTCIDMEPITSKWTENFGFTYGGAGFTVSGVMFCWEATGSLWRGLVPSRLSDLRSISWHAAFWNLHGSIGFLIGGAALYATSFSWQQLLAINGYGNLCGAAWFLLGALAALLEQANPDHP